MTGDTGIHEHMVSDDSANGAVSALAIVSTELMETIRNAHLALEDCVDGRGGTAALKRAGELLHQACGALRMTETYGAALLVEEMELGCTYLSALRSGKGREDGHTTRARWCAFAGPVKSGYAGLAILCHPDNHDAPQRVRIWPSKTHDGAVFFNYVPVQEHAWSIEPGKQATMRYRLVVHDGRTDAESVEDAWKSYAGK